MGPLRANTLFSKSNSPSTEKSKNRRSNASTNSLMDLLWKGEAINGCILASTLHTNPLESTQTCMIGQLLINQKKEKTLEELQKSQESSSSK